MLLRMLPAQLITLQPVQEVSQCRLAELYTFLPFIQRQRSREEAVGAFSENCSSQTLHATGHYL